MTESKHEKFRRIAPGRLERAVYHIGLLPILASRDYEFDIAEAKQMIQALTEAVDTVRQAFKLPAAPTPKAEPEAAPNPPPPPPPPTGTGLGSLDITEVRWALDMLQRGDVKEAKELLKRVLSDAPRDFNRTAAVERH